MQLARNAFPFIQISMGNNWNYLNKFAGIIGKTKSNIRRLKSYFELYKDCLICPNFYTDIMNNDWSHNLKTYDIDDGHPLPSDHLKFVEEQLKLPIDNHIKTRVYEHTEYILKKLRKDMDPYGNVNKKFDPWNEKSHLWFKEHYEHYNIKADPNLGLFL